MAQYYLLFKALHIIGFVSWFAGLFYIVRLFIYHVEALEKPEPDQSILHEQFKIMEVRLHNIIMIPALIITLVFGFCMIIANPAIRDLWLWIKLALVFGLILYQFSLNKIRKDLIHKSCSWTSGKLRMWNEVATLFLVAIVLLAVYRHTLDFLQAFIALIILGVLLFAGIKIYKKHLGRD